MEWIGVTLGGRGESASFSTSVRDHHRSVWPWQGKKDMNPPMAECLLYSCRSR